MPEPAVIDKDMLVIQKHVALLTEHFDTVHVFVTKHVNNSEGTVQLNHGSGNYFARYGQIVVWSDDAHDQLMEAARGLPDTEEQS